MSDLPILTALGILNTEPAMVRAALEARRIAAQTGTPLAIWRVGKVLMIPVEMLPNEPVNIAQTARPMPLQETP